MQNGQEQLTTKEYLLKYAAGPIPIFGGFFQKTTHDKVHRIVMDTSGFVGMTGFMMLGIFGHSMMDPWPLRAVKMLGEMYIGGLAGRVSASLVFMLVDLMVQKCGTPSSELNEHTPLV